MVVLVQLQMLVQVIDALGEQGNLNLGRAGVAFVAAIGADDFLFGHGGVPPLSFCPQAKRTVGVLG